MLEPRATHFGENIRFSRDLLPDVKSVTFVSKPNSLLRVKLTAAAQWPRVHAHVSCPEIGFPEAVSNVVGVLGVIQEMVGDIDRIRKYPGLGYQAAHELPDEVLEAWRYLVSQGFTGHMIGDARS